jgi:hypothetical protein
MQGTPSGETKWIKSALQLEGETNAELIRSGIRRLVDTGAVPGLDAPVPGDDVGRFGAPERRGDAALDAGDNYGDRVTGDFSTACIVPPENIRAQAWAAADIARGRNPIEGTGIYPSQYVRESMAGDADDNSYSLPVQEGSGEWRN